MSNKIIILEKTETINGFTIKWIAKNITPSGSNLVDFQYKDINKIENQLIEFAIMLYGDDKSWKIVWNEDVEGE